MFYMLDKVRRTISEYGMLKEGEAVLCGLSGGADSVTLLLCLRELGYEVEAMHVNHRLRGGESDRDEEFCRRLCERLGVPLAVECVDVNGYCAETGTSCEEGARELRYAAFERSPVEKIATAHTLTDSLETAVFNLARGTGARGLCGIPPVRGRFIRPLINCTRQEIEEYLSRRGQGYVTDSTNLEDEFSRNRIRHGILPVLRGLNPGAEAAFGRLSRSLRADDEYLFCLAARLLGEAKCREGYGTDKLAEAEEPVLSRAVILLLKESGTAYDSGRVAELCGMIRRRGGKVCLSGNVYALCSGGVFRIAEPAEASHEALTVEGEGEYEVCGRRISIIIAKKDQISCKINKMFTYTAADYDKIKGVISIRTRRGGDSIRLEGRGCTKSVKKLFAERIPSERRERVLLVCDGEGPGMIEGFGTAERWAADDGTERLLLFGVKND